MNNPSLLLFDLGGVLIENAVFDRLQILLPTPPERAQLKQRWLDSLAVRRFELGELSATGFAESFLAEWQLPLTIPAFLEEFSSWPSHFYPGAQDLLRNLRRRYRVGCLSNSNKLHWEKFGGFRDDFDIAMSSHLIGAIKPEEAAFLRALELCDVAPDSVAFFDDSLANVQTARQLGMQAFHTEGIMAVMHALHKQELLR